MYQHASAPRAVQEGGRTGIAIIESSASKRASHTTQGAAKKKYRDPLLAEAHAAATTFVQPNIMFDPRVARGPTAGRTAVLAATLPRPDGSESATAASASASAGPSASALAAQAAKAHKASLLASGAIRPKHASAAYIHSHIRVEKRRVEVPVHLYLEEQKVPTIVHHLSAQTDAWMEEAPAPAYVPRKFGRDQASQVDNAMVFSFDADVSAILEVLVSKTTEQALMEVREEEELEAIENHAQQLHAKFAAEEAQADERLRQERALFAAKEKMLAEARARHVHVLAVRAKLAAGYFARHYLRQLRPHVLESLTRDGFFAARDDVSRQLEADYLPKVLQEASLDLAKVDGSRALVADMLAEELTKKQQEKRLLVEAREAEEARLAEVARLARLAAEELARRQRKIQLFIHAAALPAEANPVGPINLTGQSTVADIEAKVVRWMEQNLPDLAPEAEVPPREQLRFKWNGRTLDAADAQTQVYDLGLTAALATLTMEVERPPPPPPSEDKKKKKKKKQRKPKAEDGEEAENGEDAEDEEEDGEDGEDEDEDGEDEDDDEEEDGEDAEAEEDGGEEEQPAAEEDEEEV